MGPPLRINSWLTVIASFHSNMMWGWNNPLPIKKSTQSISQGPWKIGLANRVFNRRPGSDQHIQDYRTPGIIWRPRSSLHLTFSSLSSLQLAFFVSPPPSLLPIRRPRCHPGIYRGNDLRRQGQRNSPNASDSGITLV